MADRNRHGTLAAIALPVLFLAMSGLARASTINGHEHQRQRRRQSSRCDSAASSGDTINFSVSGTIKLGSTLPAIAIQLTIDGSGQSITVDGAHSFQIFSVNSGATLNLQFLTLENGSVTGGSASEGGAILNNGMVTVTDSTFLDNQVTGVAGGNIIEGFGNGGAIYNGGALTVNNSTFSDNHATGGAGSGVETFGGNGQGGAIYNEGTATVTNSTFSYNQATGGASSAGPGGFGVGGAIESDGTLTVTNSTFSANRATGGSGGHGSPSGSGFGGAIYNASNVSTINLKSTILAGSSPNNCSSIISASYSIADDSTCFTNGTNNNVVESSTSAVGLDPAGLQNNGGPTQTIALEPNSQAVDFIPLADCTDQSMPPVQLTTDQRGLPRPDPGNPNFCDAGALELQTMPFVLAPNSERVQIARSTTPDSDQVNMAFTFTENGFPACDSGDNAFNGFTVLLRSGSCGALDDGSLELMLEPWVVHTVNHMTYGTIFQSMPPETVSARMVQLPTPAAPACGEWTVNIEVAGIDSSGLGNGPFALVLSNPDGDTGCFDITNAIVGTQTPPPPHGVRRRMRR